MEPNRTDQALAQAHSDVTADMARTETKIAALLAGVGLPLVVLVAVVPTRHLPPAVAVLLGIAGAGLAAGVIAALVALLPEGVVGAEGGTPGTFTKWAECTTEEEVLDDLAVNRRAEQVILKSRMLRRKFRAIRLGVHLSIAGMATLVLAVLVGLVA